MMWKGVGQEKRVGKEDKALFSLDEISPFFNQTCLGRKEERGGRMCRATERDVCLKQGFLQLTTQSREDGGKE